jgi:hypothetical protein
VIQEAHVTLAPPIDRVFTAFCPTGKKVFGGGGLVELWNDTNFVSEGAPIVSAQPYQTNGWNIVLNQPAQTGITQVVITVYAVCAIAAP